MRIKHMISLLLIGIIVLSLGLRPISSAGATTDAGFLLADGTITYDGWEYFHVPAVADPYDIELVCNASMEITTSIESLSDSIVEFVQEITYAPENMYLKRNEVIYNPTSYGLRFYDEDFELLSTGGTTYEVTSQVNKSSGIRTLYHVPYGASYLMFTAYFDDPMVYEWAGSFPIPFGKAGKESGVFMHNASLWEIGTIVRENYTVSGESTFDGYDTWVIEPRENFQGFDVFNDRIEFEKNSGLFLLQESEFGNTNEFQFKYKMVATDLASVIMSPPIHVDYPPMAYVLVGTMAAIALLIIVVIIKRR